MALEEKIDDLLYDHLQKKELEKFNKKLAKITENGIAYGIPNDLDIMLKLTPPLDILTPLTRLFSVQLMT
ncbi:hypothetical protein [Sphingobacterium siyangense]|uniref:hypothetical protein n=1 Tax=Sphingobacterium siyangense TaxID=459529 RepID=UPI003DA4033D